MLRRFLSGLEEAVISLLLAAMTLLVFVDVVLRFVFNTGLLWSQELTLHLSGWMVLLGASYGIKVGSHIGVDAVIKAVPPHLRRVGGIFAVSLALAYCGLMIYGAYVYGVKMHSIGLELEDMPIPRWIAHGAIMILGFGMLAFRLIELMVKIFRGQAQSFNLSDEAKESLKLAEEAREAAAGGGR